MFDFADINCLLALKLNDSKVHYFIVKVKLIKFYKNVSLYSVTTRFIPYDLCLVVVAMWQWLTFAFADMSPWNGLPFLEENYYLCW